MGRVAERSQLTATEYLAWERAQPAKHEFFDGEVFAMAGGTPRHNALCVSMGAELRAVLRPRGCAVLSSDQHFAFPPQDRYVYPDITVIIAADAPFAPVGALVEYASGMKAIRNVAQ
ncbi:MAG TPA: Uma2 family endonuclease [Kofleriaceae bacterium]|jgi:Uma2 family endonuclease|nr:Uma2 family endonuclease [Kofleriaceae bacterium]